jgi:hypothetical protein
MRFEGRCALQLRHYSLLTLPGPEPATTCFAPTNRSLGSSGALSGFLISHGDLGKFGRPWILDRAYVLGTVVQLRFNKAFCSMLLQRANDVRTHSTLATSGRRVPKARPSLIELIPLNTPSVL